jgi:predicted nuclease of predicted toxin-antitoxin system
VADLYFDHNVAVETALLLRNAGHTALSARDRSLERAGDQVHLLTAAESGSVLVTHNAKDFVLLHDAWLLWSRSWNVTEAHPGILVIPQPPVWSPNRAAQELAQFFQTIISLRNELYSWQSSRQWVRRTGPGGG